MFSVLLFFFKQKTAYDMRISDWSSDVCSSDLHHDAMEEAASAKGDRPDARRPSLDPSEIAETPRASLDTIVLRARNEHLPAPVIVQPPGAPNLFGPLNGQVWTITTKSQNRPQVRSVSFDPATGIEASRPGFAAKHEIGKASGRERG